MVTETHIATINNAVADISTAGHIPWDYHYETKNEKTALVYRQSATAMQSLADAMKAVESIISHHASVLEDNGCAAGISSIEFNGRWVVTCYVRGWEEEKPRREIRLTFQDGRWRLGRLISRQAIASETGASIDFLRGIEEALTIIEAIPGHFTPDSFADQVFRKVRSLVFGSNLDCREMLKALDLFRDADTWTDLLSSDIDDIAARYIKAMYAKTLRNARVCQYPSVPSAKCKATEVIKQKVATSAVYFGWEHGIVTYVGKASNLASRLSSHHVIGPSEDVSWLPFRDGERDYAELYYIGLLCPSRNYGGKFAARYSESDEVAVEST